MPVCRSFARTRTALLVAAAALCSLLLASCGLRGSRLRAEQAVTEFHQRFKREQYDVIYERSDSSLKKTWTRADFAAYLGDIHSRLGNAGKAVARGFQVNASTGQGIEVALAMETEFEHGTAEERFVWRIEDSRAVLLGYQADVKPSAGPRTV